MSVSWVCSSLMSRAPLGLTWKLHVLTYILNKCLDLDYMISECIKRLSLKLSPSIFHSLFDPFSVTNTVTTQHWSSTHSKFPLFVCFFFPFLKRLSAARFMSKSTTAKPVWWVDYRSNPITLSPTCRILKRLAGPTQSTPLCCSNTVEIY